MAPQCYYLGYLGCKNAWNRHRLVYACSIRRACPRSDRGWVYCDGWRFVEVVVLGSDHVCEYDAPMQQLQVIDLVTLGRNLLGAHCLHAPRDIHVSLPTKVLRIRTERFFSDLYYW